MLFRYFSIHLSLESQAVLVAFHIAPATTVLQRGIFFQKAMSPGRCQLERLIRPSFFEPHDRITPLKAKRISVSRFTGSCQKTRRDKGYTFDKTKLCASSHGAVDKASNNEKPTTLDNHSSLPLQQTKPTVMASLPTELILAIFENLPPKRIPLIPNADEKTQMRELLSPFLACKSLELEKNKILRKCAFVFDMKFPSFDVIKAELDVPLAYRPHVQHLELNMDVPVQHLGSHNLAELELFIKAAGRTLQNLSSIHVNLYGDPSKAATLKIKNTGHVFTKIHPKKNMTCALIALQRIASGPYKVTVSKMHNETILSDDISPITEVTSKAKLIEEMISNVGARYEITTAYPTPESSDVEWLDELDEDAEVWFEDAFVEQHT
ncbi:hypothetical protein LTR37_001572 [Vermiconidia calcicola]|uniref:Uncharacterized protein n=1 Tax=Vermiconidia calcicola TaxID=1690605 RepID=A0ACC3NVL0_9PEZI|nr:hypothetical protein LTR37_001572 [Vermiconidia calcicola]